MNTRDMQEVQETSSHQEALRDNLVTPQEARERGLRFGKQPPESETCKFCGREVQPKGIIFNGDIIWQPFPPRCDCDQARAYWQAYDEKQKRQEEQAEEAARRKEMQERIDRLIGQSGIKKRFRQRTFPNFQCDTAGRQKNYDIAKEYADNFATHRARGDGLYIEGTNGTGKTHLAAAIALQLIGEGIPVICKTSSDLLGDIKKSFSVEDVKEHEVLDVYKKVDLLIIDDLGKEQCSDWSMSTLYSILNDRYEDMRPTIVTTNYNVNHLTKALTPKGFDDTKIVAIISRLRESCTVMTMAWTDARGGA